MTSLRALLVFLLCLSIMFPPALSEAGARKHVTPERSLGERAARALKEWIKVKASKALGSISKVDRIQHARFPMKFESGGDQIRVTNYDPSDRYYRFIHTNKDGETRQIAVEATSPETIKELAHPVKIRSILLNEAMTRAGHTVGHFPMEAIQFYAALGALNLIDASLHYKTNPNAFQAYLKSLEEPMTYFGFFAFMVANQMVGFTGTALNLLSGKIGTQGTMTRKIFTQLGARANWFMGQMGMAAGMFASNLVEQIGHDVNIKFIRECKRRARAGLEITEEDKKLCDKALNAAFDTWLSEEGLNHLKPGVVSLIASGLVSGIIRQNVVRAFYTRSSLKAAVTGGQGSSLVLRRWAVSMRLSRAIDLSQKFFGWRKLGFTIGFSVTGIAGSFAFLAVDHMFFTPVVQTAWATHRAERDLKKQEMRVLDSFTRSFMGTTDKIPKNSELDRRYTVVQGLIKDTLFKDHPANQTGKWSPSSQFQRHSEILERIYKSQKTGFMRNGVNLLVDLKDENKEEDGDMKTIGEKLNASIKAYYESHVLWRQNTLSKYMTASIGWEEFIARFAAEFQSTYKFYKNYLDNRDKVKFDSMDPTRGYWVSRVLNEGIFDWGEISRFDNNSLRIYLVAHSAGFPREFIREAPIHRIYNILKYLEKVDELDRPVYVKAFSMKLPESDVFNKSRKEIQDRIKLAISQGVTPYSNPEDPSDYLIHPLIKFHLSMSRAAKNRITTDSGFLPFATEGIMELYSSAEWLVYQMACGPEAEKRSDLLGAGSSIPTNIEKELGGLKTPKFYPPRITKLKPVACNGRTARTVYSPFVEIVDGKQKQYKNLLHFINENLKEEVARDFVSENEGNWWNKYVTPGLQAMLDRYADQEYEMTKQYLLPNIYRTDISDPRKWWLPSYAERGEEIFRGLGQRITGFFTGQIRNDTRTPDIFDADLMNFGYPFGLRMSTLAEADVYARMLAILFTGKQDAEYDQEFKKLKIILNEFLQWQNEKVSRPDWILAKYPHLNEYFEKLKQMAQQVPQGDGITPEQAAQIVQENTDMIRAAEESPAAKLAFIRTSYKDDVMAIFEKRFPEEGPDAESNQAVLAIVKRILGGFDSTWSEQEKFEMTATPPTPK